MLDGETGDAASTMTLYLQGCLSADQETISCPLATSIVMFVVHYCQTADMLQVVFVEDQDTTSSRDQCCLLNRDALSEHQVEFVTLAQIPQVVKNVMLPSVYEPALCLVRSGLCVLLRHIVRTCHRLAPHFNVIDLLGFRQGSMRMCAEVSGFTKLCEVELKLAVTDFIHCLRDLNQKKNEGNAKQTAVRKIVLPAALIKLESHFQKKCLIHNDNKKRRRELTNLKRFVSEVLNQKNLSHGPTELKVSSSEPSFNGDARTVLDHCCTAHSHSLRTKGNTHIESITCHNPFKDQKFDSDQVHAIMSPSKKQCINITTGQESFHVDIEKLTDKLTRLHIDHTHCLQHGVRRMRVDKVLISDSQAGEENLIDDINSKLMVSELSPPHSTSFSDCLPVINQSSGLKQTLPADLMFLVDQLTFDDIQYDHTYSEGIEMTLADLILFVYFYHLVEALDFNCGQLADHTPRLVHWACNMSSLQPVLAAMSSLGWETSKLLTSLRAGPDSLSVNQLPVVSNEAHSHWQLTVDTSLTNDNVEDSDDVELSRCAKMKHRAIKPEVAQILSKLQEAGIRPVRGSHICGDKVELDWGSLPEGVHPKEGNVPEVRTQRKCQQLENITAAVIKQAKDNHILVDFCSGGGHLGILMAYLLPGCQVFLVENKEESLLRATSRLKSLNLNNVTLYQCNLDYFVGGFDVGVCLHACGSATDMVLQLCLRSRASFVICPCCYGSIQKSHLITYPQSILFQKEAVTYKDFLTLGHAADQTEFSIALEEQGRQCMSLVDTDRAECARDQGYQVVLCSLKPLSCTPKNNLLIGSPNI